MACPKHTSLLDRMPPEGYDMIYSCECVNDIFY